MKTYRAKRKYLSDSDDEVFSSSPQPSPQTSPLKPVSDTVLNTRKIPVSPKPRKKAKTNKPAVQMTLSLGQTTSTTCATCGMTYHVANSVDVASHKSFHATALHGPKWRAAATLVCEEKTAAVYKSRNLTHPSVVQLVKLVNSELNAPEPVLSAEAAIYVYVVNQRAVGCVLVDRIAHCKLLDTTAGTLGRKEYPAIMGVSRMYVSQLYRRQGIVTKLLDLAKSDFIFGLELAKGSVAFTQPSEGGLKVAEKWTGAVRVYVEGGTTGN